MRKGLGKTPEFFHRKLNESDMQKQALSKIIIASKPFLASFIVAYRIATFKNPHSNGENVSSPAATDILKQRLGESYAKTSSENCTCR
jgi:K+-transporting ATPase A subunit